MRASPPYAITISPPEPDVETLGDHYNKRVPLPCIPEYHDLSRDSQLMKPTVTLQALNQISLVSIPTNTNRYLGVEACQSHHMYNTTVCVHAYHMLDSHHIYLAPCNEYLLSNAYLVSTELDKASRNNEYQASV
jgi:hypothetical protein